MKAHRKRSEGQTEVLRIQEQDFADRAEKIRAALGTSASEEDILSPFDAQRFIALIMKMYSTTLKQSASYIQDGALSETDQWPFFLMEGELKRLRMPREKREVFSSSSDEEEKQRIAELEQATGILILQRMNGNDAGFFEGLAKLLKARSKGKELRTLKHSDLGLKKGKGRQRHAFALENMVVTAVWIVGNRYIMPGVKMPRDELYAEINRLAQANGLGARYKIPEVEFSRWISQLKLTDFVTRLKPGPKRGSRQTVHAISKKRLS